MTSRWPHQLARIAENASSMRRRIASSRADFASAGKKRLGWTDADFAAGTVLDLYNCRRKQSLIDQGVFKLSQVQKDDLGRL